MCNSVWPHRPQPTRLPHPWDSPGKNTGVGCHFLLQCMKVKSESELPRGMLKLDALEAVPAQPVQTQLFTLLFTLVNSFANADIFDFSVFRIQSPLSRLLPPHIESTVRAYWFFFFDVSRLLVCLFLFSPSHWHYLCSVWYSLSLDLW